MIIMFSPSRRTLKPAPHESPSRQTLKLYPHEDSPSTTLNTPPLSCAPGGARFQRVYAGHKYATNYTLHIEGYSFCLVDQSAVKRPGINMFAEITLILSHNITLHLLNLLIILFLP